MKHDIADLQRIFHHCFFATTNTILVRVDHEPIYLPAGAGRPHNELVFAHGFFASALHETAHWCIAGEKRRRQVDFGYWYRPDGRTAEQQNEFLRVESKPQALEWLFAEAANFPFHYSFDNLEGDPGDEKAFAERVREEKENYIRRGLPPRGEQFRAALAAFYQPLISARASNCNETLF